LLPVVSRWGGVAHKVFLCFCFLTNCIVSSMLLLGGSSVVNALTGMDIYLASFLIVSAALSQYSSPNPIISV
jgi:Na+/proline symporter